MRSEAAATADAFNALAAPRRRQILDLLVGGERPVNDLVRLLGLLQALPIPLVRSAGRLALPELVFLGDELLDRPVHLRVVHSSSDRVAV